MMKLRFEPVRESTSLSFAARAIVATLVGVAVMVMLSNCVLGSEEPVVPEEPVSRELATPVPRGVVAAATRQAGTATTQLGALSSDVAPGESGIWVTGTGEMAIEPDLAILHLGVETFELTVAEANRGAADAMDAIMGALRSNGVDDRDMQTDNYNVWPQYEWVEVTENGRRVNKQNLIGYKVANSLKAKVRDLDVVGNLIDQVVSSGGDASRFHGLQFTVEDTSDLMEDLREQAVLDAMAKAQHIADTAGVALGSLGYITDQPVRTYSTWEAQPMKADTRALSSAAASTPISGGELRGLLDCPCSICHPVVQRSQRGTQAAGRQLAGRAGDGRARGRAWV